MLSLHLSTVNNLLLGAVDNAGKAGLAMFAMRGKEYLTAVRSQGGLLELHTMHFADEVRDPRSEIDDLPEKVDLSTQEIKTAEQLIGMLAVDWDPGQWHDTYEDQAKQLIQDKLAGREIAVSSGPAPEATNIVDLMDALRRSLDTARQSPETAPAPATGKPTGHRTTPSRAAGTPKPTGAKKTTSTKATPHQKPTKRASATGKQQLSELTKTELYKRATDLDIPHRSTMTRAELQHALEQAAPTTKRRHLRSA
ncbi:Ku protein [Kitasatospora sp. NPDC059973]|uniref:Ku protein n=1 Tax=Kitasatospora sp. NPDC059973 TaxID=3347020 RepID=UPI0036CCA70C